MPDLIKAIILGIIEGLTEFLPVSSTGHLVLCEHWMRINLEDPATIWKTFAVVIQIGAIAAVVVYFRRRIMDLLLGPKMGTSGFPVEASTAIAPVDDAVQSSDPTDAVPTDPHEPEIILTPQQRLHIIKMIILGTLPALVIGYVTHDWIEANLGSTWIVAMSLLIGGILMLVIETFRPKPNTLGMHEITWKQALSIGFAQTLAALFPGTSRSAATIMGGMVGGLSREAAAEFSFFLAIPIMCAACGFSMLKYVLKHPSITLQQVLLIVIGTLVSFLVAWAVIKWFMAYVRRKTFTPFALYRIVLAIIVFLAT